MNFDRMHSSYPTPFSPPYPNQLQAFFFFPFIKSSLNEPTSLGDGVCPRGWSTRVIPLKKVDSSSPTSNPMPITSQLGVGFCVLLAPSKLRFCLLWACTGFVHAVTIPVSSPVQCPAVSGKHSVLTVIHHLYLLHSFCPYSKKSPEPGGWGVIGVSRDVFLYCSFYYHTKLPLVHS